MRWLYHLLPAAEPIGDPYSPAGFAAERFIHASYLPEVRESARRYFPAGAQLLVLQIDPRRVRWTEAATPRGPMPHLLEPVPAVAIARRLTLDELDSAPDAR
jgi:uncharacterized protein (DUF952 family)